MKPVVAQPLVQQVVGVHQLQLQELKQKYVDLIVLGKKNQFYHAFLG